jgi:hypothetical protein
MEYTDPETFQKVRDHKLIAKRYFMSGWMVIDFVATFPWDDVVQFDNLVLAKLLRLTRLSRLWALLD